MYRGKSNFRGRGGGRGGGRTAPQRNRPRGLFADGIWQCDCTPRLPAEHFKVKKDGPNHGKWFHTCQQHETKRCGFFLWDEDAKPREESAVLSGKRTEPGVQAGWNAGRERTDSSSNIPQGRGLFQRRGQEAGMSGDESTQSESSPPAATPKTRISNGTKRSGHVAELDDDEFDDFPLSGDDEEMFAKAAETLAPVTPHKAQKIGVNAPPATTAKRRLPWLEQAKDATHIEPAEDYFTTPSKPPTTHSQAISTQTEPGTPSAPPPLATATTPSPPTRHKDALVNPADDTSSLTSEVLASLSSIHMPAATLSNVRSILTRHDLKTQGIKKGRDISRLALQAKDAKIAELQARIASLEADRELQRGIERLSRKGNG